MRSLVVASMIFLSLSRRGSTETAAPRPAAGGRRVARRGEGRDLAQQRPDRGPLVAHQLAVEEVERLDARGALVQGVDLGVPDVLLDRVVLEESRAAERLQREG